jgi:hypothetical protein
VDVPTRLELNGNILTQNLEHHRFAYPVTADPKLPYGLGVYLNLWDGEANAIQYAAGGSIAALTLYGCNFARQ